MVAKNEVAFEIKEPHDTHASVWCVYVHSVCVCVYTSLSSIHINIPCPHVMPHANSLLQTTVSYQMAEEAAAAITQTVIGGMAEEAAAAITQTVSTGLCGIPVSRFVGVGVGVSSGMLPHAVCRL